MPQARAALAARRAELERRVDATRAGLAEVEHLPRLLLVEAEFETARLTAERDWMAALVADLDGGRLDWPDDIRELEVPVN